MLNTILLLIIALSATLLYFIAAAILQELKTNSALILTIVNFLYSEREIETKSQGPIQ